MQFASLGSGSRGNSTLVEVDRHLLMVDNGFTIRETERRIARLGKGASDISAILVTHEHSDHISGVAPFARKYKLPVYATPGTADKAGLSDLETFTEINCHTAFTIDDVHITPVAVPHDAREPCQFIISNDGIRLGILTDVGHITPHVIELYQSCHGLLLEFNHDVLMLEDGPYPYSLKRRVGGDLGHLNNDQSIQLLERIDLVVLMQLVVGHVSDKNNETDLVADLLDVALRGWAGEMVIACQAEGCEWRVLGGV